MIEYADFLIVSKINERNIEGKKPSRWYEHSIDISAVKLEASNCYVYC